MSVLQVWHGTLHHNSTYRTYWSVFNLIKKRGIYECIDFRHVCSSTISFYWCNMFHQMCNARVQYLTSNAYNPHNPIVLSNITTFTYNYNLLDFGWLSPNRQDNLWCPSKPSIHLKHDLRHRFYLDCLAPERKCPEQNVWALFFIVLLQGLQKLQCHVAGPCRNGLQAGDNPSWSWTTWWWWKRNPIPQTRKDWPKICEGLEIGHATQICVG